MGVRFLKWTAVAFAILVVAAVAGIALGGLDALRGPIARITQDKTGRELRIEGSLRPVWSWLHPRIRAERVSFANPGWANGKWLLQADAVELTVEVLPLLLGRIVMPEVALERAVVDLEEDAQGRKSWVLDERPHKESRVSIRRLTLDHGQLVYDDAVRDISLHAELETDPSGIRFTTKGKYHGLPMTAAGHGGPVLALKAADQPYPLKGEAKIGDTAAQVDGKITGLIGLSGLDMAIQLSGQSMDQLYKVIGVAFPTTSPYTTSGHLIRDHRLVRYENFTGKVGKSDLAGTLQVDTSGDRPVMSGDLHSKVLDLADLGPVVGARSDKKKSGVLPDAPFEAKRWQSVDADVKLVAGTLRRPEQLPLDDLKTRIRMKDAVLTLDPLEFGAAGGKLGGSIRLDGSKEPIRGQANVHVQSLQLAKLFPTVKVTKASVGDLSGAIELAGTGNSVAHLLGSANGKIGLFMDGGRVSELVMEMVAIDIWGMTRVKLKGDKQVPIRCVVGDFGVKDGIMQTNALIFDTEVVNVTGQGQVDLKHERLDLTLNPHPKDPSLLSLRSPLYIRGTFSKPEVAPDMKNIAAKGVGAAVLAIVNPLLAVLPLISEGKGKDSPCGKYIAELSEESRKAAAKAPGASVGPSR